MDEGRELSVFDIKERIHALAASPGALRAANLESKLDGLLETTEALAARDPAGGLQVYEYFISMITGQAPWLAAGVGDASAFGARLCGGWVKLRQATGAPARETAVEISRWIRTGYGGQFVSSRTASFSQNLDAAGAEALEASFLHGFDVDPEKTSWRMALRSFYSTRGLIDKYIAFAQKDGVTIGDCDALAGLLMNAGRLEEALAWAERGNPSMSPHLPELNSRRREILAKMGRREEALDSAWEAFLIDIRQRALQEVLRYAPEGKIDIWRAHALREAENRLHPTGLELLYQEGEYARIARLVMDLPSKAWKEVNGHDMEKAASAMSVAEPAAAAELSRLVGMRILSHSKLRSSEALEHLERARDWFQRAGLAYKWHDCVNEVRQRYALRPSFMKRFEKLAAGQKP